jgi:hypothetical protein
MKTDKKFTTVAEIAKKIGLNHLALRLLDYLDQYHPDMEIPLYCKKPKANVIVC